MKLAIIGSRTWPRDQTFRIDDYIASLPPDTVIITGGWKSRAGGYHVVEPRGVDGLAWKAAERRGLVVCVVSGSSTKHKHMAGVQRNPVIAEISDAAAAFWDGESRGTARTLAEFIKLSKQAVVIAPGGGVYELQHWHARVAYVLGPKG